MKILITGNMGYIGPNVVSHFRNVFPGATLVGYDTGYFAGALTTPLPLPECMLNTQIFGDVRAVPDEVFQGVDAVVHLAAISNDPMGNAFEEVTMQVNYQATVQMARQAKKAGAKAYVFASSCAVYGFAEDGARTETSALNPLTAYARSKIASEIDLQPLADKNFKITCLRFATACGMSPRLRLDLVLNDFVASAIAAKKITILSDGTPWRPLINTHDMARAFEWGIIRDTSGSGDFLVVNVGSNEWNYQVKELALAVQKEIPGAEVSINKNAAPDKRSYKVDFSLYKKLAPNHQPANDLTATIRQLRSGLEAINFNDPNFRESRMIRLRMINHFKAQGQLTETLHWKHS